MAPAVGAYCALAARDWWVAEDAYITFRYARNWATGHGPRFNLGSEAPVEGYSNFLWLVLCTVMEAVGASPVTWAPAISFGTGLLAMGLTVHLLRLARVGPWSAALALLALGTSAPFVTWTTSGLASMPLTALLLAGFVGTLRAETVRDGCLLGLVGASLCLVRTEGPAWWAVALCCGGAVRWRERRSLEPLGYALAVSLPVLATHLVWRHATYGDWVANTARAKVSLSVEVVQRGLRYVAGFLVSTALPVVGLLALVRERTPLVLGTAAVLLCCLGYGAAVGGDYMVDFRLLVPALPFAAVLMGRVLESLSWRPQVGLTLAVVALGAAPLFNLRALPQALVQATSTDDRDAPARRGKSIDKPTARLKGRVLGEWARPGDRLVTVAIGKLGYYSNVYLYDRHGLVNRAVAAREVDELRRPGHDKLVPVSFFYELRPSLLGFTVVPDGPRAAKEIEAAIRRLRPRDPRGLYAPDVRRVELPGSDPVWGVGLRLAEDPKAEWRTYTRRLETLGRVR